MVFGKLFRSLTGGHQDSGPVADPVEYRGYTIEAEPINEGGQFRTAGFISRQQDGEIKRVQFIRADQHSDVQSAIDHSLSKGRQIIDEQGESLLDKSRL